MSTSLLVLAAHPDDETVGAAGFLLRARGAAVAFLTDGAPRDPALRPTLPGDRADAARARRAEAEAALALAGLGPDRLFRLGAVDQEAVDALAPLARELAALVARLCPRLLVTHPFEGGHPDHDAAALAARAALELVGRRGGQVPRLVEMTSYHRGPPGLQTGAFLGGPGAPPVVVRALSPAHRRLKRAMLDTYRSQRAVLAPIGVDEERFRRAAPVDLRARPHAPPLHYEALGWTSFERFRDRAREALDALGLPEAAWA